MSELHAASFGAAFVLGLFGSVHCLGMCGGIAAALGHSVALGRGGPASVADHLLYNGARVSSYVVVGALAGSLGLLLSSTIGPAGETALRAALGLVLVALGLQISGPWHPFWRPFRALEGAGLGVWRRLVPLVGSVATSSPRRRLVVLGALWGWLPCGLVYGAAAGAAAAGSAADGALVMAGFGLGTLPALLSAGALGGRLRQLTTGPRARAAAGVFVAGVGLWTLGGSLMTMHGDEHARHGPGTPTQDAVLEVGDDAERILAWWR